MKTQLLSRAGKTMLSPVVLCYLSAFAVPAVARAQPQFSDPTCTVQSVNMMGQLYWEIQGVTSVTGFPLKPASSVSYTIQFQQRVGGMGGWINLFSASGSTTSSNGKASVDTGFLQLDPGPKQGDQYRFVVTGT